MPTNDATKAITRYLDAALKLLDSTRKDLEPAAGDRGIVRAFAVPDSIDKERRTIRFVCSTSQVDRYGEIVEPEAIRRGLERAFTEPVGLAGHIHVAPDGSPTSIARWFDFKVTGDTFEATAQFMENDALAEKYWQRYSQGIQKAVSIGFISKKAEMRDVEVEGTRMRVRVFVDVDVIEISFVAVGANLQALAKHLGGALERSVAVAWGDSSEELAAFYAALIDKLTPVVGEVVEQSLKEHIARAMRELLVDPTGPVKDFILDVVESLGLSGHRCGYDVDADQVAGASGDERDNERILRMCDSVIERTA